MEERLHCRTFVHPSVQRLGWLLFFFFFKDCAFIVTDKGSGGQAGTDIFLLSLMTPIPFHGLVSRLNHTQSL